MNTTVIHNIGQLATPQGTAAKGGPAQAEVQLLQDAHVVLHGDHIFSVGTGPLQKDQFPDATWMDAGGRLVTPGLVDAHTHLVFGGWRAHELPLKLRNVPYLEILKQGCGILSTVRATREASEEELANKAEKALQEMLHLGTTTCEAKSGYGLTLEDELKQLRAVRALNERQPVELVSTLMAAHAVPAEYKDNRRGYIELIINTILPAVAEQGLAEFCDVFCETGVFSARETEEILTAAKALGLGLKVHADEIDAIGGSEVAGKLRAISAEHLIAANQHGIAALAEGGVIACLLPATSLYLNTTFAPAQALMQAGVPIAIASDFNPGSCPNLNLQLCITLGCLKYRLQPEEVLTAVTLNAAAAIGRADTIGTLEPGKQADLVIWDAPDLPYLCYRLGSNLVERVIKRGVVVV